MKRILSRTPASIIATLLITLTSLSAVAGAVSGLDAFVSLFDMKNLAIWHMQYGEDPDSSVDALHDAGKRTSREIDRFIDDCRGELSLVEFGYVVTASRRVDDYLDGSEVEYVDVALGELISVIADRARMAARARVADDARQSLNRMISWDDYVGLKAEDFYREPDFTRYIEDLKEDPARSIWFMEETAGRAELWYIDESGSLVKERVRPGAVIMNGRFTIRSVSVHSVEMADKDGEVITLGLISSIRAPEGQIFLRQARMEIVPAFGASASYSVEDGGKLKVYLKVLEGMRVVKDATLRARGRRYQPDNRGIFAITWGASELSRNPQVHLVTLDGRPDVGIELTLNNSVRGAMWNHMGFVRAQAGVGFSPGLAELSVHGVRGNFASAFIVASDAMNRSDDILTLSFRPSLELGVTGTIGPKFRLFNVDVLGKNLGAEASAYVGATGRLGGAINQSYMFPQPENPEQVKAQLAIVSYQLLSAMNPVIGMFVGPAVERLTNVDFDTYMSNKAFWLTASLRMHGGVRAFLGLTDGPGEDSKNQANLTLANATAGLTFNSRIEGGVSSGMDTVTMEPMPEKYFVSLRSDIFGDYNAEFLALKLFRIPTFPPLFRDSRRATCGTSMTFRFDQEKRLEAAFVVVSVGYEIYGWSASQAVRDIAAWLRDNGGTAQDMAELTDLNGMTRTLIFIIDRDNTEKYFGEWAAFARALLEENREQSDGSVVARVRGLTSAYADIFERMADVPIPYIARTTMVTDLFKPRLNVDISLGVKLELGVNAIFSKSKIFTSETGTLSRFRLYPERKYNYDIIMARADREINHMFGVWGDRIGEEIQRGTSYVWRKARDGTLYLVHEAQGVVEDTVFVIKRGVNGAVEVSRLVGREARNFLASVWDTLGIGWNYVSTGASTVAGGVSGAVSSAWNWIWN